MGGISVGQVILTQFPFSDLSSKKVRPCLVIGLAEFDDMVVCQVTSKRFGSKNAVPFSTTDFRIGSIVVDSFIRPDKIATLDQSMAYQKLGVLHAPKLNEVRRVLESIFGLC